MGTYTQLNKLIVSALRNVNRSVTKENRNSKCRAVQAAVSTTESRRVGRWEYGCQESGDRGSKAETLSQYRPLPIFKD